MSDTADEKVHVENHSPGFAGDLPARPISSQMAPRIFVNVPASERIGLQTGVQFGHESGMSGNQLARFSLREPPGNRQRVAGRP